MPFQVILFSVHSSGLILVLDEGLFSCVTEHTYQHCPVRNTLFCLRRQLPIKPISSNSQPFCLIFWGSKLYMYITTGPSVVILFQLYNEKKMTWNETTCQKYKSKASVQAQCVLASYIEFTTNSFGNLEERSRYMTANTDNRWVQTRPVDMGKSLKILCHIFLV